MKRAALLFILLAIAVTAEAGPSPNVSPRKGVIDRIPLEQTDNWCRQMRNSWGMGSTYTYWWGYTVATCPGVRSVTFLSWDTTSFPNDAALAGLGVEYALMYNECNVSTQCATPPEVAAAHLVGVALPAIRQHTPDMRLIVGGATADPCGRDWMTDLFDEVVRLAGELPPEIAGAHWHLWPDLIAQDWRTGYGPCAEQEYGLAAWREQLDAVQLWQQEHAPGREAWLTEWGWHWDGHSEEIRLDYMGDLLAYFDNAGRWWDTTYYFAYTDDRSPSRDLALCNRPGCTPTAVGALWKAWQPAPAVYDAAYSVALPVSMGSPEAYP